VAGVDPVPEVEEPVVAPPPESSVVVAESPESSVVLGESSEPPVVVAESSVVVPPDEPSVVALDEPPVVAVEDPPAEVVAVSVCVVVVLADDLLPLSPPLRMTTNAMRSTAMAPSTMPARWTPERAESRSPPGGGVSGVLMWLKGTAHAAGSPRLPYRAGRARC
jgi:hypothetical protein